MNALAKPLSAKQIETAQVLHGRLQQWRETDEALQELGRRFPDFDGPSALLKVTAINALYGTRILAVNRMARHVQGVMDGRGEGMANSDLVERLAALPAGKGQPPREYLSFASKFAHFFIDSNLPIKDRFAEKALRFHLGPRRPDRQHPYRQYVADFQRLKELSKFSGESRKLDHYLWLAGQYLEWRRNRGIKLGREVVALFTDPDCAAELDAALPSVIGQSLKGEIK